MIKLGKILLKTGIIALSYLPIQKTFAQERTNYPRTEIGVNWGKEILNYKKNHLIIDGLYIEAKFEGGNFFSSFEASVNDYNSKNYGKTGFGFYTIKKGNFKFGPQLSLLNEIIKTEIIYPEKRQVNKLKLFLCASLNFSYKTKFFENNSEINFPMSNFGNFYFYTRDKLKSKIGNLEIMLKGNNFKEGYAEFKWTGNLKSENRKTKRVQPFAKFSIKGIPEELEGYGNFFEVGISFSEINIKKF